VGVVDEGVLEPEHVVLVVLVPLVVDQFEYCDLHHRLLEVGRLVLDHLDGYDLVRDQVLALDHLAERSLAQHVED